MHCRTRGIMSIWNLRRFNPAYKPVHIVSVQKKLEYLPIVFQVQFKTCQGPITRISSSYDAAQTRHTQNFNPTAICQKWREGPERIPVRINYCVPFVGDASSEASCAVARGVAYSSGWCGQAAIPRRRRPPTRSQRSCGHAVQTRIITALARGQYPASRDVVDMSLSDLGRAANQI